MIGSPPGPVVTGFLVVYPLFGIGRRFKWFFARGALRTKGHWLFATLERLYLKVVFAKVQSTARIATIGLTATNMVYAAVDGLFTIRVVAGPGHIEANVAVPVFVVSDWPVHDAVYPLCVHTENLYGMTLIEKPFPARNAATAIVFCKMGPVSNSANGAGVKLCTPYMISIRSPTPSIPIACFILPAQNS